MIVIGDKKVNEIVFGNDCIEYVYRGNVLVYEKIFTKKLRPGVIVFYDTEKKIKRAAKPSKISKIDLDRYVPIGIIVTPYNSSEPLMISLTLMQCNNPTIGSIDKSDSLSNRIDMKWGPSITISGVQNIKNKEEALSDFNGKQWTDAIIKARGKEDYTKWKPNDLTGSLDYPAASCCDIFYTLGTEQQKWYLPACGELAYIVDGYYDINVALQILVNKGCFVCTLDNDRYWSSNDYGGLYAWNIVVNSGSIDYNNKVTNGYKVRAFYKLNANEIV